MQPRAVRRWRATPHSAEAPHPGYDQAVPLYDFKCAACDARFEAQMPYGELAPCPECGTAGADRQLTPFSGPFTVGMRGYAGRQSNAQRAAREEQRAERKQARREQQAKG
jgi:putative FmdB family regulatory protein